MIGKLIGAWAGAKAAKRTKGIDEPGGAVMGIAAVALARRFGIPGMIAAAAGGYALKRYNERRDAEKRQPARARRSASRATPRAT